MTIKILQEVTEWSGIDPAPNHVYLMTGDKAWAYVPWGRGRPVYFKTFQRIDRRGRKFQEVKGNPWKFDLGRVPADSGEVKPQGQTWTVTGSKGSIYTVTLESGRWGCSCPGHGFRGRCRHVDEFRASNPQLG